MDKSTLAEILEKHAKWLCDEEGGERADLSDAYLRNANLSDAYLRGADLSGADLSDADLSDADLSDAYLSDANLSGADLSGANLSDANLSGANLRNANLSDANLSDANLRGADLSGADLRGADLSDADLSDAYLRGADLYGSNVQHNKFILSASLGNYAVYLYLDKSGVHVTAGCRRSLTLQQARERWSIENKGGWSENTDEYSQRQLAMVNFLAEQAKLLGWPVDKETKNDEAA